MLTSIDFDDELAVEADQIEDVILEWDLPSKLDSAQSAVTEQEPKLSFGIGRDTSHRARMRAHPRLHWLMMWRFRQGPLTQPSA
jgi:hypothetical protein